MVAPSLIAFDTNLVLRLLTNDDPDQARIVQQRLLAAQEGHNQVFLPLIVLAEAGHVLAGPRYRLPRERIADAIGALLSTAVFVIERRDAVAAALGDYRGGEGSLADYLIGRCAEAAGAAITLTFDRALHRHAGFSAP